MIFDNLQKNIRKLSLAPIEMVCMKATRARVIYASKRAAVLGLEISLL